jgi:hypothetical protein
VALILLFLLISGINAYDVARQRAHPAQYARKAADKALQKYLREATAAARALSPSFYTLAENGLMRYLTDKYSISNHLSTAAKIESLRSLGIPEDVLQRTIAFLDTCARARFMPSDASAVNMDADLDALQPLVNSFSRLREANHA